MTFALAGFRAVAEKSDEANSSRFRQVFILDITGANSDNVADLSEVETPGTFWSDVDTAAGTIGEKALKAFKDLKVAADQIVGLSSEALLLKEAKATGATLSAGEYKLSFNDKVPDIEFEATDAPTAYTVRLEYDLKKDVNPILVEA